MEPQKKKNKAIFILPVVLLIGSFIAYRQINYNLHFEDTENAQVETNINPVVSRMSGYVDQIRFKENQSVKQGDTLLLMDNRDLIIKVQQAEIAVANARANVEILKANAGVSTAGIQTSAAGISSAEASLETAKVRVWKATQDFNRIKNLVADKSGTQQAYDNAVAEKETAEKQLVFLQKQVILAKNQEEVSESQLGGSNKQIQMAEIMVRQRLSELDLAKLQLSYSAVIAPISGYVSKKAILPGQYINVGQALCAIVDESTFWVTANFKETQIQKMKVGQHVKLEIDAYPDQEFEGEIESLSAATGARFALLPPDNATGNFVKVVQRIPIRIAFRNLGKSYPLRAGMNVKAVVSI
jgi:membrane fusion protein, multidrug efflux system